MGLTLEHFVKIPGVELRQMDTNELKVVLQSIALHTNVRLSQLKKAKLEHISKAGDVLLVSYPHGLSGKGVTNRNDLIRQIKAGQRFLSGSTSTVRGTKKMIKNILDKANIPYDKDTATDKYIRKFGSDFWEIYRKLSEESQSYKEDSDGLIQAISDVMDEDEDDIDDILNRARERYNESEYGEGISFVSNEDLSSRYSRR